MKENIDFDLLAIRSQLIKANANVVNKVSCERGLEQITLGLPTPEQQPAADVTGKFVLFAPTLSDKNIQSMIVEVRDHQIPCGFSTSHARFYRTIIAVGDWSDADLSSLVLAGGNVISVKTKSKLKAELENQA